MSDNATECLKCGETRGAVRNEGLICGSVDYFGELQEEYGNHRWADWNDNDLKGQGILPEHFHLYRRAGLLDFQYVPCEQRGKDHVFSDDGPPPKGICIRCWTDNRELGPHDA